MTENGKEDEEKLGRGEGIRREKGRGEDGKEGFIEKEESWKEGGQKGGDESMMKKKMMMMEMKKIILIMMEVSRRLRQKKRMEKDKKWNTNDKE